MLTQQRHEIILELLREKGSITVTEVKDLLDTSESTVRRDITALDKEGKLEKVFGGAVELKERVTAYEYSVAEKMGLKLEEKDRIAKYAAGLIQDEDFVYIDAGTTTGDILKFLKVTRAVFVTNAVVHAQTLAGRGFKVLLVGGELKSTTEAVIGNQAMNTIRGYHFTKGFFGTNGLTRKSGCTTPACYNIKKREFLLSQYDRGDVYETNTHDRFKARNVHSQTGSHCRGADHPG